jgi:hypothetical protein
VIAPERPAPTLDPMRPSGCDLPVLGASPAPASLQQAGAPPAAATNPFLLDETEQDAAGDQHPAGSVASAASTARSDATPSKQTLQLDGPFKQPAGTPAPPPPPPPKAHSPQQPDNPFHQPANPFRHPSPLSGASSASSSLSGHANPFLPRPPPMRPPSAPSQRPRATPTTPQPNPQPTQPPRPRARAAPSSEERYSLESSPALSPLVRAAQAITHAALHPHEPVTGPSPQPSPKPSELGAGPEGAGPGQGDLYYSREATIADVIERQMVGGGGPLCLPALPGPPRRRANNF